VVIHNTPMFHRVYQWNQNPDPAMCHIEFMALFVAVMRGSIFASRQQRIFSDALHPRRYQRERKEVLIAYRFALQYYRSTVSSRSELLSTPVTKFGDPRGAAASFPGRPGRIPPSASRGDLPSPTPIWLWAEPFLLFLLCVICFVVSNFWCVLFCVPFSAKV
jgi:hypothetical protein